MGSHMDRSLGINCGSLVAALAFAFSTASAAPQTAPPCQPGPCEQIVDRSWGDATGIYQRKQEFVAALRQLSIALAGRFGDEGRSLRSDIDSLELALHRWDQAIGAFEADLHRRGLNADAHVALGSVYLDRFRIEDALRSFEAASKLDANRPDVFEFIAMAHGLAKRPPDAVQALQRAARLQPDNVVVRYELARYAMESDQSSSNAVFAAFQDAADKHLAQNPAPVSFARPGLLRQVPGVAPIFPPAPYVHAFELLMQGRFEQAIAECRTAVDGDPLFEMSDDDDPLMGGAAALRRGDVADALKHLGVAVQSTPRRSEAHRVLGIASRLDEQLDQSLQAYTAAVQLRPADERSRMGLADVLTDMQRFAEAEQLLKQTVAIVPGTVQARYRLGRLYQSQGNYPEALKELAYAAQFTPVIGQDALQEMVGLIYATQADFAAVTQALRKLVVVNPNNADAHRRLGDAYARQELPMQALAEFTAALLIDRRNVLSHVGISQLHFREGRHQAAVHAAESALQLQPSHAEARYVRAMSLMRLGQMGEGQRELQEFQRLQAEAAAITQRKYETDGLRRQIDLATAAGDYQTAIPLMRRIIELEPTVASHYADLGVTLAKINQALDAIRAFETALERQSSDINVHRQLAEAYLAAGRVDDSRREAARYRELIETAKKQRALRFATP
jgi:tetratricopeptide (TPR) repeat protein